MTAPMQKGPGFLSQVFGGPTPQSGDPQATHRAEQQALIKSGLTLASHRGPGALLASIGAGQKAYAETAQAAAMEAEIQRREQTRQLLQESMLEEANDPQSLISLARKVLSYGDDDGAKAILEMAKVQASLKANLRTQLMQGKNGNWQLINLDTGDIIRDYQNETPDFERTPDEELDASVKLQTNFQNVVKSQQFEEQAVYVQQLRSTTPSALEGNSEAQEGFFRALFRIMNPNLGRVPDEEVFAQANQEGLMTGRIASALQQISEGKYPGSAISGWLPTVNEVIASRISLFDGHREHFRNEALNFKLNPDIIYDYFRNERISSIPGLSRESADKLDKHFKKVPR